MSQTTEMVKVTQLPIIEEQLREIQAWVQQAVANVESLVCNEDTLLETKSLRTDLRHMFDELETRRKDVLREVEAPIDQFKATYKECVSDYFKKADAILRYKINTVESEMKGACEQKLRTYFDELSESRRLGFLTFEQSGVVVSLTDARAKTQPPKKLREQVEQFVERVAQDIDTISNMPDGTEILSVYKETLNLSSSIYIVNERHKAIERARAEQESRNAAKTQEVEAVRKMEAFAPPVVEESSAVQDDQLTVTFSVTDTLERLKLLKQFLDANGYKYTN